jgi:hypothetical protein
MDHELDAWSPIPGVQQELFGMVVNADANFTKLPAPCAICAAGVGTITPGKGPHHAALYCVRGHFQRWLPRGVGNHD